MVRVRVMVMVRVKARFKVRVSYFMTSAPRAYTIDSHPSHVQSAVIDSKSNAYIRVMVRLGLWLG